MRGRQIVERVWEWLGAEQRLGELIIAFLLLHILLLLLPQSPVSPAAEPAFARWLAELRPTLGAWSAPLAAVGLLSLRTSLWMRGALGLLGLVTLVRLADLGERWAGWGRGWRWRQAGLIAGSLLFIGGWGAAVLGGWVEPNLVAWPQSPLAIAERGIVLDEPRFPLLTRQYGLYLLPQGQAPGLEVRAFAANGENPAVPLGLSRAVRSSPEEMLRLAFTAQTPEAYFTLPDAGLIFRISQSPDADDPRLQLQAYRSASGDLVAEVQFDADRTLAIDDVQVQIQYTMLPRLTAIYNPGALFQILGSGLFIGASLGRERKKEAEEEIPPEGTPLSEIALEDDDSVPEDVPETIPET